MTGPQIPRYKSAENCPNIEKHTACPTGYLQWHEWARRMSRTHRQRKCTTCGFYAEWVPK
jgi:hypothetical protein